VGACLLSGPSGQRFLLFVGTPRSGHSLVGALLDAHRHAVVSHELDALEQIRDGASGEQLLARIVATSRRQAEEGRGQGKTAAYRFDYRVPGQWQGRVDGAWRLIGDKKGGGTTSLLAERPELLDVLRERVGLPLTLLHVVRHPLDNVATMARRGSGSVDEALERFTWLQDRIAALRASTDARWLTLHHEDLVAAPRDELRRLARDLGLRPPDDWVEAAAERVYERPHRSRDLVPWTEAQRAAVAELVARTPTLRRYSL